jgi:hypothetical protein
MLESAGHSATGRAFDCFTKNKAFAGIITENYKTGNCRVYFNSTATRGSARAFPSVQAAADYIVKRRTSKGWRT